MASTNDPFNLTRFKAAQDTVYHRVVAELSQGDKRSHWMWFIFPQFNGLGRSATANHYAIKSLDEARAYLADTLLGGRLHECCELLEQLKDLNASQIFGSPDDLKLRSCLTLFAAVSEDASIFHRLLTKYFRGQADALTLRLLEQ